MKILAALLSLLLVTSAYAQTGSPKTATELNTEVGTSLASGQTPAITAAQLRQVLLDIIASEIGPTAGVTAGPNKVLAGPTSGATSAAPTFRALVASDIPGGAGGGGAGTTISSLGALCNGSDETALLTTALTAVSTSTQLVINCPIFVGSPSSITAAAGSQIGFSGNGQIQTAFGGLTQLNIVYHGSYTDNCPTVTIAGNATVGAVACKLVGVTFTSNAVGLGYRPADILTLTGGTLSSGFTAAKVTVVTTSIASATVAAGGASGTPGACTVTGTTGSGASGAINRFTAAVTINGGGAISSVNSISSAGAYTTTPTVLTAEPVTGCGLSGAQLNLTTQIATAIVTNPNSGSYSSLPSIPISISGGTGAGATIATAQWGLKSIAVGTAGTYATAAIPAVTVTGVTTGAATVQPVGQPITLNGSIVATTNQIFGGYGLIGGAPTLTEFPIQWWGAKCNNANDDTTAIQMTLLSALQMTNGSTVRLPAGRCLISNAILGVLTANKSTQIVGAGADITEIKQTADADVFDIVYNSSGWWIRSGATNVGVGAKFSGFTLLNGSGSNTTRSAIRLLGETVAGRPNPKTIFENVDAHQDGGAGNWNVVFDVRNQGLVYFLHNACRFANQGLVGTCIQLDNSQSDATGVTEYVMDGLETTFGQYSIRIIGYAEGLFVNNYNGILCVTCIDWQSPNLQSDFHMSNFFINSRSFGVNITNVSWVQIGLGTFTGVSGLGTSIKATCVQQSNYAVGTSFVSGAVAIDLYTSGCAGANQSQLITGGTFGTYGTAKVRYDVTAGTQATFFGQGTGVGTTIIGDPAQTAKGNATVAIGFSNDVDGNNSVAIGNGNDVSGTATFGVGLSNIVHGVYTTGMGFAATDRSRWCGMHYANGTVTGSGQGIAQSVFGCNLFGRTTSTSAFVLGASGNGAINGSNCYKMVDGLSALLRIDVVGKNRTTAGQFFGQTGVTGILDMSASVTTWTSISAGTTGGTATTVAFAADAQNCIRITVTPPNTDTWDWNASVSGVEAQ